MTRLSLSAAAAAVALSLLSPAAAAAGSEIATVADMAGYVTMEREGTTFAVAVGTPLYAADVLKTGKSGKVRVLLKDNSVLAVGPRSQVKLSTLTLAQNRSFVIDVVVGRFKMDVAKWFEGLTEGRITTPSAVAGVRGTVVWGDTELDAVCALAGEIELTATSSGKSAALKDGNCRGGMKDGKLNALSPSPADLTRYLDEVSIR